MYQYIGRAEGAGGVGNRIKCMVNVLYIGQ